MQLPGILTGLSVQMGLGDTLHSRWSYVSIPLPELDGEGPLKASANFSQVVFLVLVVWKPPSSIAMNYSQCPGIPEEYSKPSTGFIIRANSSVLMEFLNSLSG